MIGPPRRRRRLRSTRTKHVYDRLGRNTSAIDSDETRSRSTRTKHVRDRLGRNIRSCFTVEVSHVTTRTRFRDERRERRRVVAVRGDSSTLNLERLSSRPRRLIPSELSPHATERESISGGTVQCVTLSSAATFALNSQSRSSAYPHVGICTFPYHSTLSMAMSPGSTNRSSFS